MKKKIFSLILRADLLLAFLIFCPPGVAIDSVARKADTTDPIFYQETIVDISKAPFNAVCNGEVDDTKAITEAAKVAAVKSASINLPPSAKGCVIGNATINVPVTSNGGSLKLITGQTVVLTRGIRARPDALLFRNALPGQGSVKFHGSQDEVFPDWWSTNSTPGTTDMAGAIQAAVNSEARRVRFLSVLYLTNSVTSVAASNLELIGSENTVIHSVRPVADAKNIKHNYAFEIDGDVSQTNVIFRNLQFTGRGFWGGLHSSMLYRNPGWGRGGYPNIDEANYSTTRTNFQLKDCIFTGPYYECAFLTNVSIEVQNIHAKSVGNHGNLGAFEIRNTKGVKISDVEIIWFVNKGINTNFVDGVTYSNITLKDGSGGNDGAGFYFGHFNRNSVLTNCQFESASAYDAFLKVSHYATNTTISNSNFKGTGFIMIQAAQTLSMSNVTVETSGPRALQMLYHDGFGPVIENQDVKIIDCKFFSTERGSVKPIVIDLGWGKRTVFENNEVRGNVFANPVRDLTFRNNRVYYASSYSATPVPALFFQDFSDSASCIISGNRLETTADESTIYLNGSAKPANIELTGNTISHNSTRSYAIVANYVTTGKFLYRDNVIFGKRTSDELFCNYTDRSRVSIQKP